MLVLPGISYSSPFQDFLILLFGIGIAILTLIPVSKCLGQESTPNSTFSVSGIVRQAKSGESLPNAIILVRGTGLATVSNPDGFFSIKNIPGDTATFEVRYVGFATAAFTVRQRDATSVITLALEEATNELQGVVISDKPEEMISLRGQSISQITISPSEIAALPSIGDRDIFRSMQLLPGVSATNETSAGLYVRGGTPDQNLVLFDGFTVYHVDHFYGFFSAFNAAAIKDVQFYKGGFEAKFGGRISSVVDLKGKDGNSQRPGIEAGISALSAKLAVEVPFGQGRGSVLLAGRRSYTDVINGGLYNQINDLMSRESADNGPLSGLQFQNRPEFYFYDLNAKVSYRPSTKDIVTLSFYNGEDHLDNSRSINSDQIFSARLSEFFRFENVTTDLTDWGNIGSSVKWGRQWDHSFYSNILVGYSEFFSERDRTSFTTIEIDTVSFSLEGSAIEDNILKDYSLRWDNEWKANKNHNIGFGIQLTSNDINYDFTINDSIEVINRNDTGEIFAGYLQDQIRIGDFLVLNPGLRATHYGLTDKNYLEPRLSFSLDLTKSLKLKAATGKYYQFINRIIREDVTQGSREFWLLSNEQTIPVSSSIHYIAGFSLDLDHFLIDVEAFHKQMDGLSEFSLRFQPLQQAEGASQFFFTGTGFAEGVELLVQKKFGNLSGWVGYTLSQVRYSFPELNSETYPALHDQTHEINFVATYDWKRWTFGSIWIYATGKPYTAPTGTYRIRLLDGEENTYFRVSSKNALRLPDYHRMDLSATYNFPVGKGEGRIGMSLFNFYGRENVWYKEYDIIEGELVETDVITLGFTPNLFLNIKF